MRQSSLTTIGRFAFHLDGLELESPSTRKARAILAYLVRNRERDIARERLMEIFWPEIEPERARDNLNTALWGIRKTLRSAEIDPNTVLIAGRTTVRWAAPTALDADRLERAVRGNNLDDLRAAVDSFDGEFLEGDFDDWATTERERLGALYETALSRLVAEARDVDAAQRLIARNPYSEESYAVLIAAEVDAGRRIAAAALIGRARAALAEVGATPSETFERRFAQLADVPQARTERRLRIPFVGRAAELELLHEMLEAGRSQVAIVSGEAGIGKSTLVEAATRHARDRGHRTFTLYGLAEDPRPLGPWREFFESALGSALEKVLETSMGFNAMQTLAHTTLDQLEASWIVVEDAHWLGGESLAMLRTFLGSAAQRGHVVIVATRPEAVASLRSIVGYDAVELALGPLAQAEVHEALALATGNELLHEVAEELHRRSGGHPLFLKALVDELARTGLLKRSDGRWNVADFASLETLLPSSIPRYVRERLAQRAPAVTVVAAALAFEPSSPLPELCTATKLDESDVLDAIDDLLAIGLLVEAPSGPHFAFVHDLVRQAATTLLDQAARMRLHRGFADALAEGASADAMVRRAVHLEALGATEDAARAYARAAWEAIASFRTRDGVEIARRGLALLDAVYADRFDRIRFELNLYAGNAHAWVGELTEAWRCADEAVRVAKHIRDADAHAQALSIARGLLLMHDGDAPRALATSERALEILGGARTLTACYALIVRVRALRALGRIDASIAAALELEALAEEVGSPYHATSALASWFVALSSAWRFADARALRERYERAAHAGEPHSAFDFHWHAATLAYFERRDDDVVREIDAGRRIIAELPKEQRFRGGLRDFCYAEFHHGFTLGTLACARGEWDEALAYASELMTMSLSSHRAYRVRARTLEIDALLGRGLAGDRARAEHASLGLVPIEAWDVQYMSMTPEVIRARLAALRDDAKAPSLIRAALDSLARYADVAPLDADRAYAALAEAAERARQPKLAEAAHERAEHYRQRRAGGGVVV